MILRQILILKRTLNDNNYFLFLFLFFLRDNCTYDVNKIDTDFIKGGKMKKLLLLTLCAISLVCFSCKHSKSSKNPTDSQTLDSLFESTTPDNKTVPVAIPSVCSKAKDEVAKSNVGKLGEFVYLKKQSEKLDDLFPYFYYSPSDVIVESTKLTPACEALLKKADTTDNIDGDKEIRAYRFREENAACLVDIFRCDNKNWLTASSKHTTFKFSEFIRPDCQKGISIRSDNPTLQIVLPKSFAECIVEPAYGVIDDFAGADDVIVEVKIDGKIPQINLKVDKLLSYPVNEDIDFRGYNQ